MIKVLKMREVRVIVDVGADDDFTLNCEHHFEIVGTSYQQVRDKLIEKLNSIQLKWVKKYSSIDKKGVRTDGDYSYAWYQLRDDVIAWLKNNDIDSQSSVCIGGNQTISIDFYL